MRIDRAKIKIFVLLMAVATLLVFLDAVFLNSFLKESVIYAMTPFTRGTLAVSDRVFSVARFLGEIKNLGDENSDLRAENRVLLSRLAESRDLAAENELLRRQMGVGEKSGFSLLAGEAVGFDPIGAGSSALIDKGSSNGLDKNMPVIMSGNVILGKISSVYNKYSEVMLISDAANKVSVRTEKGSSGVMKGTAGGLLLMDLVEKTAALNEGDLVETSGLDGVYPGGLIVGRVNKVIADEESIFKQAYIRPEWNNFRDRLVFVLINYLK